MRNRVIQPSSGRRMLMVDGKFRYISRVSGAVEVAPNDPSDIRESCI